MKDFFRGYKDYIENIAGLAIMFSIMIAGFSYFDMSEIERFVSESGIWGPTILVLAKASTMIFAPISGSPLYPLAGALFGIYQGSLLLILGDFIGSVVSFYISRIFGRRAVERFARGNVPVIDRILRFMETSRGFLLARVCFIAMPEAVSYAAGLTRIAFARFIVISTAIGIVPTIVLASAGSWIALGTDSGSALALVIIGLIISVSGGIAFIRMSGSVPSDTDASGSTEPQKDK